MVGRRAGQGCGGVRYGDGVPDILCVTDAPWVVNELEAALARPGTTLHVVPTAREALAWLWAVASGDPDRAGDHTLPDLIIADLQTGSAGGVALAREVQLEAGAGRLPEIPVILLLDRVADVFLASRSAAAGWLIKPLEALRLRRAVERVLAGERHTEHYGGPTVTPAATA